MKDFFWEILDKLFIRTGLHQFEKLKEKGDAAVTELITELVKTSKKFGHIPEDQKKKVIINGMMNDEDFKALTPRKVNQWLSKYWAGLSDATKQKLIYGDKPSNTEEHCDPKEAQKYIDEWKKQFSNLDFSHLEPKPTQKRVFKSLQEVEAIRPKQKVVDCPGFIDAHEGVRKPCSGNDCPHCMGYGQIKVMA